MIRILTQKPLNGNKSSLLKFVVLTFVFTIPAFGTEDSNGILSLLQNGLHSWIPTVKTACLWIFSVLVLIDITLTFGKMALSGFEIGEFLATLIKKIITIGIFLFLFNVDYWLEIIFNSFSQLATNVNGGLTVTPNNLITTALKILSIIIKKMSFLNAIFLAACGIIILIAFVFMAIDLLIVYLKFYLTTILTFFALALGGLEHFKQIGLNPVLTGIKIGVELFMIQGLIALSINSINSSFSELSKNFSTDLVTQILVMSIIFCMITKMIPGMIEAVFQGSIGESAGAAGGFRAAAALVGGMAATAISGTIGTTRAMNAAKQLHLAKGGEDGMGGKYGMDLIKGVTKNLATTTGEHLKENFVHARGVHSVANRLQAKLEPKPKKDNTESGEISGENKNKNEPYHSGIE